MWCIAISICAFGLGGWLGSWRTAIYFQNPLWQARANLEMETINAQTEKKRLEISRMLDQQIEN